MSETTEEMCPGEIEGGAECLLRKGGGEKNPDFILSSMRANPENHALQESGILALSALARDVPQAREIIARLHGISYVLKINCRKNLQVQAAVVAFVANMALSKNNHEDIVQNKGVENVLLSMDESQDSSVIQRLCCTALCNLTKDNVNMKSFVVKKGALEKVLNSLEVHRDDPEVQQMGFSMLRNLASMEEVVRQKIANLNGVTILTSGIASHRSNEYVALQGISAILNLSCGNEARRIEIAQKCIPGILLSMQAHSERHEIVSNAVSLLSNLASVDSNRHLIRQHSGVEIVLSSLQTFSSRPEVLENACSALCNLALSTEIRVDICQLGGSRLLNQTMRRFQETATLQKAAIAAHKNLVSEDTKRFIEEEFPGTINAIVTAMRTHTGDFHLQTEASSALCNFATDETAAAYMASKSVAKFLISAMIDHPTRVEVQSSACKALGNLVLGCSDNLSVIIENRGMEAMLTAMSAHTSSVGVQEGCFCVLSAVARDESIGLPQHEQETTLDLVLAALLNHPSSDIVNMSGLYILAALIQNSNNNLQHILSREPIKIVTDAVDRLPQGSGMESVGEWILDTLTSRGEI